MCVSTLALIRTRIFGAGLSASSQVAVATEMQSRYWRSSEYGYLRECIAKAAPAGRKGSHLVLRILNLTERRIKACVPVLLRPAGPRVTICTKSAG